MWITLTESWVFWIITIRIFTACMYFRFTFINYFWFISYWAIYVNQNENQNSWKMKVKVGPGITAPRWLRQRSALRQKTLSRLESDLLTPSYTDDTPRNSQPLLWYRLDLPKPWVAQYPILIRCRWTHGFLSGGLQTVRVPSSLWTIYRTLTRLYRVRPLLFSFKDFWLEVSNWPEAKKTDQSRSDL